jgi:hypothetical protein
MRSASARVVGIWAWTEVGWRAAAATIASATTQGLVKFVRKMRVTP